MQFFQRKESAGQVEAPGLLVTRVGPGRSKRLDAQQQSAVGTYGGFDRGNQSGTYPASVPGLGHGHQVDLGSLGKVSLMQQHTDSFSFGVDGQQGGQCPGCLHIFGDGAFDTEPLWEAPQ